MKKQAKVKRLTLKQRVDEAFVRIAALNIEVQANAKDILNRYSRFNSHQERIKDLQEISMENSQTLQAHEKRTNAVMDRVSKVEGLKDTLGERMKVLGITVAKRIRDNEEADVLRTTRVNEFIKSGDERFDKITEFINNSKRGQEERIKKIEESCKFEIASFKAIVTTYIREHAEQHDKQLAGQTVEISTAVGSVKIIFPK